MNDDVEMDAPQISTLREEETPEPQPTPSRTSKFRVKLLVNEGKRASSQASSSSRKPVQGDSDDEDELEEEEEEDQLIDDDDDAKPVIAAPVPLVIPPSSRGSPSKRGRGGSRGGKRKTGRAGAPDHGKLMTWVEVVPPETTSAIAQLPPGEVWDAATGGSLTPASAPPTTKRKAAAAKGTGTRAIRKKAVKAPKIVMPSLIRDDRDDADSVMSEAYGGTAASSPMPQDGDTDIPGLHALSALSSLAAPSLEDATLDGVPLPVYPLPSKPFPVQPPQKIGSGFAPVVPLDKGGKQVRRWRQVNREIRGIAGGRWFARTWAGEKESDFASAAAAALHAAAADREHAAALGGASFSRLSSISASTPKAGSKSKIAKAEAASALVSRSGSLTAESLSAQISKRNGIVPAALVQEDTHTPNTPM